MKGAEQLVRRGRPLAQRGSWRANGETGARGQRAPFSAASCLQAGPAVRSGCLARPRCSRAQLGTMQLPTSPLQSHPTDTRYPPGFQARQAPPERARACIHAHTQARAHIHRHTLICFSPAWSCKIMLSIRSQETRPVAASPPTRLKDNRGLEGNLSA